RLLPPYLSSARRLYRASGCATTNWKGEPGIAGKKSHLLRFSTTLAAPSYPRGDATFPRLSPVAAKPKSNLAHVACTVETIAFDNPRCSQRHPLIALYLHTMASSPAPAIWTVLQSSVGPIPAYTCVRWKDTPNLRLGHLQHGERLRVLGSGKACNSKRDQPNRDRSVQQS
ncbi:unnamed protein product, partial [Ectocarpus sp. 12 AP-2014]